MRFRFVRIHHEIGDIDLTFKLIYSTIALSASVKGMHSLQCNSGLFSTTPAQLIFEICSCALALIQGTNMSLKSQSLKLTVSKVFLKKRKSKVFLCIDGALNGEGVKIVKTFIQNSFEEIARNIISLFFRKIESFDHLAILFLLLMRRGKGGAVAPPTPSYGHNFIKKRPLVYIIILS